MKYQGWALGRVYNSIAFNMFWHFVTLWPNINWLARTCDGLSCGKICDYSFNPTETESHRCGWTPYSRDCRRCEQIAEHNKCTAHFNIIIIIILLILTTIIVTLLLLIHVIIIIRWFSLHHLQDQSWHCSMGSTVHNQLVVIINGGVWLYDF